MLSVFTTTPCTCLVHTVTGGRIIGKGVGGMFKKYVAERFGGFHVCTVSNSAVGGCVRHS